MVRLVQAGEMRREGSLIPRYRAMVDAGSDNFLGLSIAQHATEIGALVDRFGAKTAIDVGCGRGDQYEEPFRLDKKWGLDSIWKYDPAFETHDALPEDGTLFDAVLCSDVLEHVPRREVDEFIETLFGYAAKFVWASVCCRPAKKLFPQDQTNLHVTVMPFSWWTERFEAARRGRAVPFFLIETP